MSQRLTVADLQNSRVPVALNVCPTDDRFYQWATEAEEKMLNQGRWYGSVVEAQFCVQPDGCFVFPRQVAAVEQLAVNGGPIMVENGWYAFTRLLTTLKQCPDCDSACSSGSCGGCGCGHLQLRMKEGNAVSFSTTMGENKKIRSYPTNSADIGKTIIYQGYDHNGIWVRTLMDGVMRDGERVTLTLPFVDTTTEWAAGSPLGVQKQTTVQRVLVYSYDTDTTLERALAIYEPGETNPSYVQGYVPGLRQAVGGCCSDDEYSETTTTITALVSLKGSTLSAPGDWLVLQNIGAYKAAMMAVKAYEEGDIARGDFYFYGTQANAKSGRGPLRVVNRGGAIPLLQAELRKNTADRVNAYVISDETNKLARQMAGFI